MAGDWIKMRKTLPADPRVIRISSALKADRLRTIGGLMSAWCLLDDQTEDGKLEGYTAEIFDELVGFPGLAQAMASVGWLEIGDGFLAAPRFSEHNGQTAKRRAQDSVRKMSAREADKCPQPKRKKSGLEKRREEKSNTPIAPKGAEGGDDGIRILPKGWQHLSQRDQKQTRCYRNSPSMIRIGSWFGRREDNLWTIAEAGTFQRIQPSPEDIEEMARYYEADIPAEDYRRRDLPTLLNNWTGELDRARIWTAENP